MFLTTRTVKERELMERSPNRGRAKEASGAILEILVSMCDSRLSSHQEAAEKRRNEWVDVKKQKEECDDLRWQVKLVSVAIRQATSRFL